MPEAAGGGHILKVPSLIVAKHAVGNDAAEVRIAGADVEIEEAVVVEIAEVSAHSEQHLVEPHAGADIGEGSIVIVVIEARPLAGIGHAQIVSSNPLGPTGRI